jgi:hypothetical protein
MGNLNERNDRVFDNQHAPMMVILEYIKSQEAELWVTMYAKCLSEPMPGE